MSGGSKAQLQMYGKTRFSSIAILIESLQRYHKIIERTVKAPAYVLAARKALKRGVWTPTEDDHGVLLKAAEEAMMEDRSPYSTGLIPFELAGLQKCSTIHQDVIFQTFWDALQVQHQQSCACHGVALS
jgi:hypothetical protein